MLIEGRGDGEWRGEKVAERFKSDGMGFDGVYMRKCGGGF